MLRYILFIIGFSSGMAAWAGACTLWGATGDSVADGGTILAKNRDWVPDHQQVLKKVAARPGRFAYFGLYADDNEYSGFKSGINEKGLAVESASASSLPKADRASGKKKNNLVRTLLEKYATVADAVKDTSVFEGSHPEFLLLADQTSVASVEIDREGKVSIRTQTSGTVGHTNHYLDPDFASSNVKIGTSSLTRFKRVTRLLDSTQSPWTLEAFIKISQDQNNGPDNSLWRTGTSPGDERTLATWIVRLPKDGAPELYVKLANPDAPVQVEQFTLGPDFWK